MPCNDWPSGPVHYVQDTESQRKLKQVEAMLCAVLTAAKNSEELLALDRTLINRVNEGEAGISSKSILEWWVRHQAADVRRKRAEQEERERRETKRKALAKLTDAERKVLGLK